MTEKVLESKAATRVAQAESGGGRMNMSVQLDGRTMGEIPMLRKVALAVLLTLALASSALGAFFLSGQAAGSGGTLETSVTECPMGE